ncbi:MAG: class I SAM-dependent methyltransferase [Alcaligenaceae bacterium]|nr:class I SAM-dependent methyltransferase [Alcaligenaceae bacterium]
MSSSRTLVSSRTSMPALARVFVSLLTRLRHGHVLLLTPDGSQQVFGDPHSHPGVRLIINDWRACGEILKAGDIGFAEAYRKGWVDTPDLSALLKLALRNEDALSQTVHGSALSRFWYGILHRLRPNTRSGSRRNIHAHYDLGNAFYALWLDDTWSYSSALYHGDHTLDLETAQYNKYQHIMDSLELKPGMRVLEIGCGWAGFALHAARQGVHVHAITISQAQAEKARQRVQAEQLNELVNIELCDYRDVTGSYDAVVSIEMFEAVGEKYWPGYFRVVHERLKPGGRAVVQSITIHEDRFDAYRSSSDFIRQYIFPGGMLPTIPHFVQRAEESGLTARAMVAFGPDYAETLRQWSRRFEQQLPAVRQLGFDETFIRTWFLYLSYCEAGFDEGRTDVVQFLLRK